MCGWMSMMEDMACFPDWPDASGVECEENPIELGTRWDQLLLQRIGDERLDARPVRRYSVRQGIAHQREEAAIARVLGAVAGCKPQLIEIGLFRGRECRHHCARQPRMACN